MVFFVDMPFSSSFDVCRQELPSATYGNTEAKVYYFTIFSRVANTVLYIELAEKDWNIVVLCFWDFTCEVGKNFPVLLNQKFLLTDGMYIERHNV